jgi:hypothetical protein
MITVEEVRMNCAEPTCQERPVLKLRVHAPGYHIGVEEKFWCREHLVAEKDAWRAHAKKMGVEFKEGD